MQPRPTRSSERSSQAGRLRPLSLSAGGLFARSRSSSSILLRYQRGPRPLQEGEVFFDRWGCVVFKVMTWNVENLFRPGAESGPPSQAVYDEKLAGLAAKIDGLAPDVAALQEIGDPAALDDL